MNFFWNSKALTVIVIVVVCEYKTAVPLSSYSKEEEASWELESFSFAFVCHSRRLLSARLVFQKHRLSTLLSDLK